MKVYHPKDGSWVVRDPVVDPGGGGGGFTPSFPGEPPPGKIYWGLSSSTGSPLSREAQMGATISTFRAYGANGESPAATTQKVIDTLAKNRLPMVSSKPPNDGWKSVAIGQQDAWVQDITDRFKALKKPIWWCIHHEPYDNVVNGKNWNGNPDQTQAWFRAMYDHIKTFTVGSNIVLMPIMQSAPFSPSVGGSANIVPWIPDSADIIGLDTYNHWYPTGKNKWREPEVCFGDAINAVAFTGKRVAMCEYGVRTDPSQPGRSGQWIKDVKSYLLSTGITVAASYFDSDRNVNDANPKDGLHEPPPWDLDHGGKVSAQVLETPANGYPGGPERLAAFKNVLLQSSTARLPA